jgi:hypothetical protein
MLTRCSQRRFPMVKIEQKMKTLKVIFFQYFIIPGIMDPQRCGGCEFVVLPTLKNKLQTITHVLKYAAQDREFDTISPFKGMNTLISQNRQILDNVMAQLIDSTKSGTMFSILQRLSSSLTSSVYKKSSKSLDKAKETMNLSPICISTSDMAIVFKILSQASLYKQDNIPNGIKQAFIDIQSNSHTTLSQQEKFLIMGQKDLIACDQIPNETTYINAAKANDIKYLIQQVLITVKHVQIGNTHSNQSYEQILESLYLRERINGRMIAATSIQELLKRLRNSGTKANQLFAELHDDILSRKQYIHDLIKSHQKLLVQLDIQNDYVHNLTDERDRLVLLLASWRIQPFFQSVNLAEFMRDFRRSAFVEDQEKRLRNLYFKLKDDMMQYAQRNFIPQSDFDHACTQLMRLLLRKVYRILVSPKGSPFEKKDELISGKIQKLKSIIQPGHLEIPSKYHSVCSSSFAREEMLRLDMYVLPQDKLISITKFSSILIELMRLSGDEAPGIDNFLPILIYNLILSNPPRLYSNLKYINRFEELFSDELLGCRSVYNDARDYTGEYWLRHFEAAILFIEGVEVNSLLQTNLNEEKVNHHPPHNQHHHNVEVEYQFVRAMSRHSLTPTKAETITRIPTPDTEALTVNNEPQVVEQSVKDMRRLSVQSPSSFHLASTITSSNLNFRFTDVQVDELKYSDIPNLLSEYLYAVNQLQKLSRLISSSPQASPLERKERIDSPLDSTGAPADTTLDIDPYSFRTDDHTEDILSDDEDGLEGTTSSSNTPGTPKNVVENENNNNNGW